ncbi:aspartic proteinase Asp1 [Vitis riparia]|uniref:aspartic proteinase Asp1 n=1 Tax=Vitis riparia TaxID=96939 RepID=UPI00155AB67E|nr:aspartic proteinase Asp1 [Vitis riparia]
MEIGKVGVLVVLVVLVGLSGWSSASDHQHKRKKAVFPEPAASSSLINIIQSSVVFPLYGNVYPLGYYYVSLSIGQPPKPYFLDPDTGSDLSWLQCDAPCVRCTKAPHPLYRPNNNLVICKDPMCASLHPPGYKCEHPEQCDYKVDYADDGSSLGVLVKDAFPLNFTNGLRLAPRLALGCGYDQIPGRSYHPLDGVLGLGKGKSSIVSQLHSQGVIRNVVGHCVSSRGGGFLFLGDDLYDSSRVVWTPMLRDQHTHYSSGYAELILGGKTTVFKNLLVTFDSGSSYTYLNSLAYQALVHLVRKELSEKPVREALDDETLPLCWRGKRPFKSVRDVRKFFKPLALSFPGGGRTKTQYDIPLESYLIISLKGNVCLGILNGTEAGLQDFNLIGDISMQDKLVVYDNEKNQIGWAPTNCDRLPKFKAAIL